MCILSLSCEFVNGHLDIPTPRTGSGTNRLSLADWVNPEASIKMSLHQLSGGVELED